MISRAIDIKETENDAPVIEFVNSIIFRAVKEKSDDSMRPEEFLVRFRVTASFTTSSASPKKRMPPSPPGSR